MRHDFGLSSRRSALIGCLALGLMLGARPGAAQQTPPVLIEFDTELLSLNLAGGPFLMPLASDPGNALGDSVDGYGFVNSNVLLTLSSQRPASPGPRSLGTAIALNRDAGTAAFPQQVGTQPIDPNALDGQQFFVRSFFDVFFDITLTDVDLRPGRDYATGTPTISLTNVGPASMQSNYSVLFDKDAPNFGLIPPPEAAPYLGHFDIRIDLPDINGNGTPDRLKFTLATHAVDDTGRTFITLPDGTVIDAFDSTASLAGAIQDQTSDPPFTIGMLTGPTTASSTLVNPLVGEIPEPSTLLLGAFGALGMLARRRRPGA